MSTITHKNCSGANQFIGRTHHKLSVKTSATHRLFLSIWHTLFGKSTGHAFPKIAGLFLVGILSYQPSSGQQLLDNFNRSNSNTVGGNWTEVENSSSYAQILSNTVQLGGSTDNEDYIYQDVSSIYPTTLNTNTGILTWQFNMRQNNTNPDGFDGNETGIAFVLGADNTSFTAGNGYAVVLGTTTGSTDNIRLARYSNGLDGDANITSFITGSTDYSTEYFAIRVTYNPTGNIWTLFVNTSNSAFNDPSTASYTQIGSPTANSNFTGNNLRYVGCYFNHGGNSDRGTFDNVYIPAVAPSITTQPTALSRCTGTSATFTAAASYDTGIQWQKLIAAVWTPIGGATSDTYTIPSVGVGDAGDYRVVYTNAAGTATSNAVTLTVNPAAVGGTVSSSATVCSGNNSGTLTLAGEVGTIAWQSSVNGGGLWTATGVTSNSQTYSNISVSTQYRVLMTNGVCTSTSNVVTLTPSSATAFNVTGGGAYCSNLTGVAVGLSGSQTGRTYQLMDGPTPIGAPVNGTGNSISFGLQTVGTTYTVVATVTAVAGCTNSMTGSATVVVNPAAVGGTVSTSETVCTGNNSGTLNLTGETGSITRWESSTNGGSSWSPIANTTPSHPYLNLSTTTQYRVIITNGTCTSTSTVATITTSQPTLYSVTGGGTYCAGGSGLAVGLSDSETGVEYQLLDGFTAIGLPVPGTGNAISFGVQPPATYNVLATISALSGCSRAMTGAATIIENPEPVGGTVSSSDVVCSGSNSGTLTLAGQVGTIARWESSTNGGGLWNTITNSTTSQIYTNLSTTTQYRVVMTNTGCPSSTSNVVTITTAQASLFTVTGGGSYCSGGAGVLVGLNGSELNVDYHLLRNGSNIGSPISGTGNSISFGNQTLAGTYTVVASIPSIGSCTRTMTGSVTVTVNTSPTISASLTDPMICGIGSTTLSSTAASNSSSSVSFSNTTSASIPYALFDADGHNSTIVVSGAPSTMAAIIGFSVTLNINHTRVDEVEAYLIRPGGTLSTSNSGQYYNTISNGGSVCLVADAGGTGDNFVSTVFSDLAAQTCTLANNPPFNGNYQPVNLFSSFTPSANPNGTWTLRVLDDAFNTTGTLLNWSISFTTVDGLSYTWSSTPSGFTSSLEDPGAVSPTVSTDYHVLATNIANGCTASADLSVTVNPVLTASCTVVTNASCFGATDGSIDVTATGGTPPYADAGLQSGLTDGTYMYTVTDDMGCTATCSSTITVTDVDDPIIANCPASFSVNNDIGVCGATVTWVEPTASDNCSVSSFISTQANSSLLPLGTTTVTYTAVDPSGNSSTCSFDVTVVDAELPVVTCPANITVGNTTGLCSAVVNFSATATDNCSAIISYSPASGSSFAVGTTTVTATATDPAGNSASCTFDVIVNDTQFPSFAGCPTDITISTTGSCDQTVSWTAPTASDNCAGVTLSSNHNPGDLFPVGTTIVTYTAIDGAGNTTICTFNVIVEDHENPVVTCPGDITLSANAAGCSAIATFSASATDNCSATLSYSHASGSSFSGTTLVTVTATDPSGNIGTCSFNVFVVNDLAASSSATDILCNGGSATVTVSATGGTTPYTGDGTFTALAGTHTYTVTDVNGCTSSSTITITEPTAVVASSSATAILCNGGSSTVTVSATGGTGPYTGTGSFTEVAGTYTYTVTDANGCSNTTTITITEPASISASSSAAAILCNGGSAIVTVSATGGTTPYTGTGSFSEVAGTYTYTVTDAGGCSTTTTVTLTEPTALSASSSATTIICNGGSATVTIVATGGTAPYTGDGAITATAGTHTYTVTDANGCTATTTITLSEPTAVVASSSATAILCNGGSSTVTVSATGGTSPYTGEGSFSVTAGTYTYTVTDANGCTGTTTITVTEPATLVASSSATAILCNGGSSTVTVSATGGTAPYTGTGSFSEVAGTYTYTVTDANGCTSSTSITLTEPSALSASSSATSILCNGGSATVTIVATGGTAPYTGDGAISATAGTHTYTVTDANGCTATTTITLSEPTAVVASSSATAILCNGGSSTVTVSATGGTAPYTGEGSFSEVAGTYTYTVTDANGCTGTTTITISEPTAVVASSSATAILCNGGSSTVTVSATGGTAPYTGTGSFSEVAGTYTYTVTDANGCTSSTTITITEPAVLVASSSATAILCNGGTSTVTVSATGGTAPYTGTGSFSEVAGTYTYTVTDANGCTATTTVTITEPSALSASSSATSILCNGGSSTVTVSATGGTAPYTGTGSFTEVAGTYTYTVTDANGCTATTTITLSEPTAVVASSSATAILCNGGSSTVTVSATGGTSPYTGEGSFSVTAGTYTYTVTDANGCTGTTTITVSEPAALVASSSATAILCNGGSSTVTVSATGGTAPYTGTGSFSEVAGTYTYTVTDANGCTATTSVTITEPSALSASSSATSILCNGGSSTVTVSATGGTAPYTGTGSFSEVAGTYTYTVTDANGCTATTTVTITEPSALSASSSATSILCNGGTATVTVSATGGTAPYSGTGSFSEVAGTYTYTVTDANGCTATTTITLSEPTAVVASSSATAILCNGGSSTVTVSATGGTAPYTGTGSFTEVAGTYTYTVTDANGCTATTTVTITEPSALVASSSATSILCNGGSSTVTVSATGGTAPYTGTGSFSEVAGTYTYTVTDANGCTATTTVTITEPSALSASSSATSILCNGGSATVTVSATGGTAPYTGTGSFSEVAGTYTYTVTDANGCTATTTVTITEPSALSASSSATAILCNGGSATVTVSATGGTAPYSGTGSFSEVAGTYTYTVTDANGCTATTTVTITEPSLLVASSSATAILCNGGSATVTVSATGGTAPYTGDGTFTVAPGTFTYTVTDANGCSSTTTITVSEPAVLVASSSASTISCVGGTTIVTVSATGGTTPYTGTGLYSETVGTYTYTVTDANGCTSSTTITITQVDNIDPVITGCPVNITIGTTGLCTQIVNWTAPTATDNCSATLTSNYNPGDVFPIGTTTVTYTAVDPNGNSATCSFDVTVEDNEDPIVVCPANISVSTGTGACDAVVTYSATVTDNCSATISYSIASGSTFPIGVTPVTVTATDASGNVSTCSFNVTVTDTEYPVLTACPANITTCIATVNWTAPTATDNCSVTVSSNFAPGATFPIGTTTVTYSAVDASGNTTNCSFDVTVNVSSIVPTAILSSAGNAVCGVTSTTLSVQGGTLGSGAQWVWYTGSCGGTQIGTGSSIPVTVSATTDYFVRAEGPCGNSACVSQTITLYTGGPAGIVNTISGVTSVCPGTSVVYSVNAVANTGWYVWSAPAGTLINGQVSPVTTSSLSVTITFGALPIGQSGYNICAFAANACGTTQTKCAWIRGDIGTPIYSVAPTVICVGTTVTYSVSPLSGASNYIWTATGGATISGSGASVSITFPANFTTGSICVAGQTPCGLTGTQRCVTVSGTPGLPAAILGAVKVCPGSTEVFSVPTIAGVTSYLWTAPAGASISGPANGSSVNIVFTAGFTAGQVTVVAVNACGAQSAVRAKSVSTGKLATPSNIVGDPTSGVCGQTYQYSIASLANATSGYVWTIPAGVTVIGPATSNSITLQFPSNFVSGVLSVAGNNSCGLGYARSVNVYGNPATPGAITTFTPVICAGSEVVYNWDAVPGTDYYQIQAPVGSTILSGNITTNTSVVILWGPLGGTIGVKAVNGCGVSGTRTYTGVITCRTAAEESLTDKLVVEAYPNPNHGKFSVSIDSKTDAKYTLQIVDQTGRILKVDVLNATEGMNIQEFDLEGIAAGMYMIRVVTENSEVINKSIIIQ